MGNSNKRLCELGFFTSSLIAFVLFGGICRTQPPCKIAMVSPIPRNIQPCCILVNPNV